MTHPASCGVFMPESGADGLILVQYAGPGGEEMRRYLTGSGVFVVPADVSALWVELVGGGAKGGEDGQYLAEPLNVEPGQSIPFSAGLAGNPGSDAQDSTFGSSRAAGGRSTVRPLRSGDAIDCVGRLE
jgi:hypothetical protein